MRVRATDRLAVHEGRSALAASAAAARTALALLAICASCLSGLGWLYLLQDLGWFDMGPRLGDALPLLQLAGHDAQPLVRLAVAWLGAGAAAGLALRRLTPGRRPALAGAMGCALLFLGSQASFALARNLRFEAVLFARIPGLGAWVEALVFVSTCSLAGPRPGITRAARRLYLVWRQTSPTPSRPARPTQSC